MFGASLGSLNLKDLKLKSGAQAPAYRGWEDLYRQKWTWDKVAWGTHCVDCYPGNCPYRVYVRDGLVWREEVAGTFPTIEPGVPDMNPMGCQKGAAWSQLLYAPERVLHPLKRAGERGEGKWKRVSWDEALGDIADAMLDAIEELGPESIIAEGTPAQGGMMAGLFFNRIIGLLGGVETDVNAVINDFSPGIYLTFGKFNPASSNDDWFHSELILFNMVNPVYTMMPLYHFWAEARYNGAEVVLIAPDCSPSHVHADYYFPVQPGTDAALALAMCKVIIDEKIYNAPFMKEQTDLPLLVRLDNRHFLRASDVKAGGLDDQFYFFDSKTQRVVEAPRGTLALGDVDPALEGSYSATLRDGKAVEVVPVFELMKERLVDYTPEKAHRICGVHPDSIRLMARKMAVKKTAILCGGTSFKYYHADLMVRAYLLAGALTGNWGKKGTGPIEWSTGMFDGPYLYFVKQEPGQEETKRILKQVDEVRKVVKAQDPTLTDEMVAIEMNIAMAHTVGMVPPHFFWYHCCGYSENWNKPEWNDPSMARPFDDYWKEAADKEWWKGVDRPGPNTPTRVYIECGGNTLRRTRGGGTQLLKSLWATSKMVVTIDWRMQTTGMWSDIFLPVAHHYEKATFHIPTPHLLNLTFSDKAAESPGDVKPEAAIVFLLAQKVEERAKARGIEEYIDNQGNARRLDGLYDALTLGGRLTEPEDVCDEWVRDSVLTGALPEGTTLETLKEKGYVRFVDWGISALGLNQAGPLKPDETHAAFRWHVEDKLPYPTATRRAQFYIDHDWFLEAGEELPVHKDHPKVGGDYPFQMTSGHNRWSIHSMNITNRIMQDTHRGRPHLVMNTDDAKARGIEDHEEVRVFNDGGSFITPVKLSPSVRPGQVIAYNGWEPLQYREWRCPSDTEIGMIKWLHMAGGYGHLRYWPIQWQPAPSDRAIHVDVKKLD
jgi:DMSO reductase family type II enzyme molybdopterin subunit